MPSFDTKTTPLHDEHVKAGGRLMTISGWARPLHYGSPDEEVGAVRTGLGLFDLHPMSRHIIVGSDALALMQFLVTSDVQKAVRRSAAQYTCFCDERGGIIDDALLFPRSDNEFLITSNVATSEVLANWLRHWVRETGLSVQLRDITAHETQLALQGPYCLKLVRSEIGENASELKHLRFTQTSFLGVPVFLSRTGYTGEAGFELFFDSRHAARLWRHLLDAGAELGIVPFGIVAAQMLRIEKGHALHGVDMTRENNPYEIGLGWTVCTNKEDFLGKQALAHAKAEGTERRLRRFYIEGNRTAPRGTEVHSQDRNVGIVTSCCRSPTLGRVVGMGLIETSLAEGASCHVRIGNQQWLLSFANRPFYDPNGSRLQIMLPED